MRPKQIITIIVALLFIMNLYAQYPLANNGKSPFVKVVKDIQESVVNISVEYEIKYGGINSQLPFNDDFFKFFFPDPNRNREPESRKSMAMGSGFIFKRDKNDVYILTNNHVAEKGKDGVLL
ncbi:MAG: hypothetical protein B1H06_07090 [Candidatus Cloacimonas sp. 4484_143]|nr:MAG: hypothetical protein B1H06_07090 [Candidatus Cloacimonas sp. 4484_143]